MPVVPFPDPQSSKDSSARDVSDSWFDDESEGGKMSFLEHLDELRKRIIRALLSLSVGVAIAAFFSKTSSTSSCGRCPPRFRPVRRFIFTYPTEAFMLRIRIALIAGLFIATPLIFLQVWQFVAPALYAKERRYAIPFVMLSSIGFIGGAAFSHYVAFPLMWRFFASFSDEMIVVHAADRGHLQHVHAHAARYGGRVSDAGDGVLPGADGHGYCALDDPQVQVRRCS